MKIGATFTNSCILVSWKDQGEDLESRMQSPGKRPIRSMCWLQIDEAMERLLLLFFYDCLTLTRLSEGCAL